MSNSWDIKVLRKLRTVIVIISIILAVIVWGNYYRESHRSVSLAIMSLNADTMDNLIKNWFAKQGNSDNMVLSKVTGTDKVEEYYLYLNNIKMTDVDVKPHTYDGIRIQVNTSDNATGSFQIFKIKPTDKKLKYIILNDNNKFEVSSIFVT